MDSGPTRRAKPRRPAWFAALAIGAALAGGASGPAQAGTGPSGTVPVLWQKAVEIYRANRDWHPERAVIVSEVLNTRRKLHSLTKIFVTLQPAGGGRLSIRLDRYLRNGVDKTEEMRPKFRLRDPFRMMTPSEEDGSAVSIDHSPFDPDDQGRVAVVPRGKRRIIAGHACRRFDFSFRPKSDEGGDGPRTAWEGQAWLEEKSGRPVELRFGVTPLPRKIRSMEIVYRYEAERPDRWILRDVVITGSGAFLFFKRYFTVTTTFGQYARRPRGLDPGGRPPG